MSFKKLLFVKKPLFKNISILLSTMSKISIRASDISSLARRHRYQDCRNTLIKYYSRNKDKLNTLVDIIKKKSKNSNNKEVDNFLDELLYERLQNRIENNLIDIAQYKYKKLGNIEQNTGYEYININENIDNIEKTIKNISLDSNEIKLDINDDLLKHIKNTFVNTVVEKDIVTEEDTVVEKDIVTEEDTVVEEDIVVEKDTVVEEDNVDKNIEKHKRKFITDRLIKDNNQDVVNRVLHGRINESNTVKSIKNIYPDIFEELLHNNDIYSRYFSIDIDKDKYGYIGNIDIRVIGKPDGLLYNSQSVVEIKNRKSRFWEPPYDIDQLSAYAFIMNENNQYNNGGYLVQHIKNNSGTNTKENIKYTYYSQRYLLNRFDSILTDLTKVLKNMYRIEQIINGTFKYDFTYEDIIELFDV